MPLQSINTLSRFRINENQVLSKKPNEVSAPRKALSEISNLRRPSNFQNNATKLKSIKKESFKNCTPKDELSPEQTKIIDIDKYYEGNLCLVTEYAFDVFIYLKELEVKYTIGKWPTNLKITDRMRRILVDWLIDVHVEYQLLQETLHIGITIMDRYLEKDKSITKELIQLVGVTSLCLACKYEELFVPQIEDFVYLCDKTYSKNDFIQMEKKILEALTFDLGRPVSVAFLRRYNMTIQADKTQHLYSKYIIDLALLESDLSHVKPSLIAAAAAFIAICLVQKNVNSSYWNNTLEYYSAYNYNDIRQLVNQLANLIVTSSTSKYDSVKRKYASKVHNNISAKILTSDVISKLALV